jgi:hypothetical protein
MTCGSTSVNPIGYCTGCGAFRGAEGGQPGQQAYPQQPQQYAQAQYGQPPQYQQPQYAQPPQPSHQQPPYAQPPYGAAGQFGQQPYAPPPRRSNTGLVIGIVVGVLVLLIGGGAAVALVVANGDDEPTDRPTTVSTAGTGGPSASASAQADTCMVGTWVETQSNYTMNVDGVAVNMTASGAIQRFKLDGTGELDMTAGILATGTSGGKKYERATQGKISFKYHPQDAKIYYTDVVGSGSSTVKVDGVARAPVPVSGSIDPDTYTCTGDTFEQSGPTYKIQLKRQ